jgi:adenine-specific DNA-methyltransferase
LSKAEVSNFKLVNETIVSSGWSSKDLLLSYIQNDCKPILDSKGQKTSFEISRTGAVEMVKERSTLSHVISVLQNMGSTQNMSNELAKMNIKFSFPKPNKLLEYLISFYTTQDSIILDSFAGSGTTAHAVLNLNKADKGNRKFILVEMDDYANTITAERVKKVINGYGDEKFSVDGTGGEFTFCILGEPLFNVADELNEKVPVRKIREYIYYIETGQRLKIKDDNDSFHLDTFNGISYYFYYDKDNLTTLDLDFLSGIQIKADQYVIYADNCLLPKEFMAKHNIIFKKIPRDITRF